MTAPHSSSTDRAGPSLRVPLWLFVGLAGVWGAVVLGAHYFRLPIPFSRAAGDAAQALSAARELTIGLVGEHLAVLASVLLILIAAMTAGRALLALLEVDGLRVGERRLFSAVLGGGALSYAALLLAAVGWLNTTVAWVVVGALAVAGIFQALRAASTRGSRRDARERARLSILDRVASGALSLHAGVTLLGALAPLIFYDSLAYHFVAPHLSVLNGHLLPMRENLLAQMPAAAGFLYTLAVLLKNEIAAKVLCWLCGVGVAAAIVLFARRMSWAGVGLWGALIFLTLFHVSQASTAGGIDLVLTLFSVCSVYAFLIWMEAEGQGAPRKSAVPLLVLSAVFSGLAMATKYTGVFVPAALIATLFISRWRSAADGGRCLRSSLWFVLIAGLVFSPWLVKNAVLLGNPIAPLLPGVFSEADATQVQRTQAFTEVAAQHDLHSLTDYVTLPWNITMGSVGSSFVFSPLFLLLCPLLFLFRTFPRSLRRAALVTTLFALGWILTTTAVRYLLPVLPWACLLLAHWAHHARVGMPLRIAVKSVVLATCLAGILVSWVFTFGQGGWRVVLEAQDKQDYLSQSHDGYTNPAYGLYRWIDAELPVTARVLLVGETRGFYLNRDFVASSVFDKNPLLDWAERSAGPGDLAATLWEQGITHVLLNPAEAIRLRPYGMLNTTTHGKRTLQEFWRRHVRQVASFDEPGGDQVANRVTLHAISWIGAEADELPGYMGQLLETP